MNLIKLLNTNIDSSVDKKIRNFLSYSIGLGYLFFYYFLFREIQSGVLEWTISDWLINYEDGGFKRRGLSGTVLFKIQDFTGISLQMQILFILILSYSSILFVLYKYLKNKDLDLFFISLLLSPFVLFFPFFNVVNSGRKEIFLILLFYIYAFVGKKKLSDWIVLAGYLLIIFLHESAVFYLPFLLWINYKKNDDKPDFLFVVTAVVSTVISVFVIYFFGGNINQGRSISILLERGVNLANSNIFASEFRYDFRHILKYKSSYSIHLLEFMIVFFQFSYYVFHFQKHFFREYLAGAFAGIICMIPLLYLGIDWFRWFYIYFSLLEMMIILQLPDKNISQNKHKIKLWLLLITPFMIFFFAAHMNNKAILRILGI